MYEVQPGRTRVNKRKSLEERFWEKVEFTMYCWLWKGSVNELGYGKISVNYKPKRAHRVSWELVVGKLTEGKVLDHKCYNPSCVNPLHLQEVTQKQNAENPKGAKYNSTTGVRGVSWDKSRNKYQAGVVHNRKRYAAGRFDTLEDAERAVIALRNKLFTNNLQDKRTI